MQEPEQNGVTHVYIYIHIYIYISYILVYTYTHIYIYIYIYVYIFLVNPPHGPWFGVFDQYFHVFYAFLFLGFVSKFGGCHIHIQYACMQTDVIKAMTSASAI